MADTTADGTVRFDQPQLLVDLRTKWIRVWDVADDEPEALHFARALPFTVLPEPPTGQLSAEFLWACEIAGQMPHGHRVTLCSTIPKTPLVPRRDGQY